MNIKKPEINPQIHPLFPPPPPESFPAVVLISTPPSNLYLIAISIYLRVSINFINLYIQ